MSVSNNSVSIQFDFPTSVKRKEFKLAKASPILHLFVCINLTLYFSDVGSQVFLQISLRFPDLSMILLHLKVMFMDDESIWQEV